MERFQSHGGQRRFTEALFPPLALGHCRGWDSAMPSRLRAVVLATLPCVAAWWSGADEHPAMFVRGRVAVANPQVSTRIHQSVVGVQVRPRDASRSPCDGDSCLPLIAVALANRAWRSRSALPVAVR